MTNKEKAKLISEQFHCDDVAYDAAEQMAEWKEKQMIEKACLWLSLNAGVFGFFKKIKLQNMINEFAKAMEGGEK